MLRKLSSINVDETRKSSIYWYSHFTQTMAGWKLQAHAISYKRVSRNPNKISRSVRNKGENISVRYSQTLKRDIEERLSISNLYLDSNVKFHLSSNKIELVYRSDNSPHPLRFYKITVSLNLRLIQTRHFCTL